MAKTSKVKSFQPDKGYDEVDWNAVDFPEMTDSELENVRPAKEVLPAELFEAMKEQSVSRGRPALENPKRQITLRVDEDVIARFRQSGKGWQSRINEALRKAAGL